jgi:hypothetical protein
MLTLMESVAVRQVAGVMQPLGVWWAVAGGWAIDLWVGCQTRDHHDVEVVVRRTDQQAVWDSLHNGWELLCLDPPGSAWAEWLCDTEMVQPSFQLKARAPGFEFDLFLESVSEDSWCFRRDDRVQRPIDRIVSTRAGIPIVVPEVQLLYMAKSEEPKNQHDFETVRSMLDERSSRWLRDALALVHPGHRWLDAL